MGSSFNETETRALFNMYSNGNSRLNYHDMCDYFKGLGLQAQSNLNPAYKEYRRLPDAALATIRKELSSRGLYGFSYLRKVFNRADKNGNAVLDRNEFIWCLRECKIDLTKTDYEKIFRFFDANNDNCISFTEFIEALTSQLNDQRRVVVKYAYDMLRQTEPTVSMESIAKQFNPEIHPEVKSGKQSKNEVLREFLGLFGDVDNKGITLDSWMAVWTDISTNFPTDQEFMEYMKAV